MQHKFNIKINLFNSLPEKRFFRQYKKQATMTGIKKDEIYANTAAAPAFKNPKPI